MAIRIITSTVDDIDPSQEATETVPFALDGIVYEIDLSEEHAQELRSLLEPWARAARVVSRQRQSRGRKPRDYDPVKVREWAKGQGIELGERGRIPADVITSYRASH